MGDKRTKRIDCFKTCDNTSSCERAGRCLRIAAHETVAQAKADAASWKIRNAPHGWIFLDDDGWEHDPDPQHPQKRGEAQYGTNFRPATASEAASPDFFRAQKIHIRFVVGEG